MSITNEQLAELLVGVARSQEAVIKALVHHFGTGAGNRFLGDSLIPTLQGDAHVRQHEALPTLVDLPSRLLLQLQGTARIGSPPIEEWVAQELDRLLAKSN